MSRRVFKLVCKYQGKKRTSCGNVFAVQASRHGMCNYIEEETGFHLNEHCILPGT